MLPVQPMPKKKTKQQLPCTEGGLFVAANIIANEDDDSEMDEASSEVEVSSGVVSEYSSDDKSTGQWIVKKQLIMLLEQDLKFICSERL